MELEYSDGQMEPNTTENGEIINPMAKECTLGRMVGNTLANTLRERNTEKANTDGRKDTFTKEAGRTDSSTGMAIWNGAGNA